MSNIIRERVEPYSTIFERLDELEASVAQTNSTVSTLNSDVTTLKSNMTKASNDIASLNETVEEFRNELSAATSDTGWINFPVANGVSAYSSAQQPRYRKIGNVVILTGAVKGIKKDKTIIGTLPTGFRPTKVVSFVQNMSATNNIANIARWQVQTDGDIEMQYNDFPWEELDGTEWFPIDVMFLAN